MCTQFDVLGENRRHTTMQCRVQYLNDTDPFDCASFPEPARPITFTFLTDVPLVNQLVSLKRLLGSPHYVMCTAFVADFFVHFFHLILNDYFIGGCIQLSYVGLNC